MKLLKHIEPKYLVVYVCSRLGKLGYKIYKSPRSPQHTYYLYNKNKHHYPTIRISDHCLHRNQKKQSQIDIVIQSDHSVTINDEIVLGHEVHSYKSIIVEKLIEGLENKK